MEIKNMVTIDNLTAESVSVKTQKTIVMEGITYPLGEPHRRAYANNESDREMLTNDVSEPYLSAILDVWDHAVIL